MAKKIKATKNMSKEKALKLATCPEQCGNCCLYGSGYVLDDEIKGLADAFKMNEKEFTAKYLEDSLFRTKRFRIIRQAGRPYGRCVFYEDKCTIHNIKPLHCRIGSCNEHGEELSTWFKLNYLKEKEDIIKIQSKRIFRMPEGAIDNLRFASSEHHKEDQGGKKCKKEK